MIICPLTGLVKEIILFINKTEGKNVFAPFSLTVKYKKMMYNDWSLKINQTILCKINMHSCVFGKLRSNVTTDLDISFLLRYLCHLSIWEAHTLRSCQVQLIFHPECPWQRRRTICQTATQGVMWLRSSYVWDSRVCLNRYAARWQDDPGKKKTTATRTGFEAIYHLYLFASWHFVSLHFRLHFIFHGFFFL